MVDKIKIIISTGNQAFEDDYEYEVKRILQEIIDRPLSSRKIMDINGNSVGKIELE